jgi:hypothetical protein
MTSKISSSLMHHGKRLKVEVTTNDESREGWKAAQEELDAKLRQLRKATAVKVVRQSFRKKKATKDA